MGRSRELLPTILELKKIIAIRQTKGLPRGDSASEIQVLVEKILDSVYGFGVLEIYNTTQFIDALDDLNSHLHSRTISNEEFQTFISNVNYECDKFIQNIKEMNLSLKNTPNHLIELKESVKAS